MNILVWMLFGALGGAIAHLIDLKTVKGGLGGTMLLGMVGAMMGGYVSTALFGSLTRGFDMFAFILAITTTLFFLLLQRTLLVK